MARPSEAPLRIAEYIAQHPGCYMSEAEEALGLPHMSFMFALNTLRAVGWLRSGTGLVLAGTLSLDKWGGA